MDKAELYQALAYLFKGLAYVGVLFFFLGIIWIILEESDWLFAASFIVIGVILIFIFGALHSIFQRWSDEDLRKMY